MGYKKTPNCFLTLQQQGKVHFWGVSFPVKCHKDYNLLSQIASKRKKKKQKPKQGSAGSSYFMLLLSCLLLEKHKQHWKRGQRFSIWARDHRREARNVWTFLQRMERKLTWILLCPFVFFTTLTSGQDNGISYYYWLLFNIMWLELHVFTFISSSIMAFASDNLYILQDTDSKGIC